MRKLLALSLILLASVLLAACGSLSVGPAIPAAETPTEEIQAAPTETAEEIMPEAGDVIGDSVWPEGQTQEDGQGAVTVLITALNLNAEAETIDFEVVLDTHSVELGMDLAALSALSTDTGKTVDGLLWDAPLGGHHVSGTLSFPASQDGLSILDGATELTLTIRDVDAAERVFRWLQ